MTRNTLITAVHAAAERDGMSFYTGPIYRINTDLRELPALWLHPPKVVGRQGYNEGIIVYETDVELIWPCVGDTAEDRERVWQDMEKRASEIYRALAADSCVKSVEDVKIVPAENNLTNRGEISAHLNMKVEMSFYLN